MLILVFLCSNFFNREARKVRKVRKDFLKAFFAFVASFAVSLFGFNFSDLRRDCPRCGRGGAGEHLQFFLEDGRPSDLGPIGSGCHELIFDPGGCVKGVILYFIRIQIANVGACTNRFHWKADPFAGRARGYAAKANKE